MNSVLLRRTAAVLAFLFLSTRPVCGGVHIWKGGFHSQYWSYGGNWEGGDPPQDDEDRPVVLIFPSNAQSYVTTCDLDGYYVDKMIFRAGYTVKHTGAGESEHVFGLYPGNGDRLVIESSASPTVTFDSSTFFTMGGQGNGIVRIQTGLLHMQGHFHVQNVNGYTTSIEGDGRLRLECQGGAGGNMTLNGADVFLAGGPYSQAPFVFTISASSHIYVEQNNQLAGSPVTINGGHLQLQSGVQDSVGALVLRDGGSAFTLGLGASLQLRSPVTCTAGTAFLNGDFLLGGAVREFNAAAGATLSVSGTLNDGEGVLGGNTSFTGGIRKIGDGTVSLSATGLFDGPVLVDAGMLRVSADLAFGTLAAGVTVGPDGTLILVGADVSGEALSLAGKLGVEGFPGSWAGPVSLQNTAKPMDVPWGNTLTLSGVVSGPGFLMCLNEGTLELAGSSANTYTGSTLVRGGILKLSKTSGVAVPGAMQLDSEITGHAAAVELTYDNQIADASLVQMRGAAVLDLASHSDTIGGLMSFGSGQPEVRMGNSRTMSAVFTVGANNQTTFFDGKITGADGMVLQKAGNGTLTLGAATPSALNTYGGLTRVLAGVLEVKAPQQIGNTIVNTGGYLSGTGTAGLVTLSGGNLRAEHLTTGNIGANAPGGKILADLLGPAPQPEGFDQLRVNGTVTLTGTSLLAAVPLAFTPQSGARFVIVDNDGADPVTGQFTGLPEGANLNLSGKPFSISYHGGDGNDVELKFLGTGGPPRILAVSYNRAQDKIHLEALAPPGIVCYWQVSTTLGSWSNFASGIPDAAGFLKLDQSIGLSANRLYFRLLKP